MAAGYVTNWGNDANDGLTWETSKRTFQGAKDAALIPVYAKGWFNEYAATTIVGVDSLIIDYRNNGLPPNYAKIENVNFKNSERLFVTSWGGGGNTISDVSIQLSISENFVNTVFYNCTGTLNASVKESSRFNTFHNCGNLIIFSSQTEQSATIYSNTNLESRNDFTNCLILNCPLKFVHGSTGNDETIFVYPTGANDTEKLQNLRDRMAIVYGGLASDYLIGCKYYSGSYNDIFIDADNGDFNLVPFCIAAHMSYEGDYIGARPEGIKADWDTEFTNIVNIDSIGNVTDQNIDATAQSTIQDIGHIRTILDFKALGSRAARNGQRVNTESDLNPATISAGTNVLADATVYQVINDTITLNNAATTGFIPWNTFTAVDEGGGAGLGFTGSGQVQEVYTDDRYDEKVQFKSSKTDATLSAAVLITSKLHSDPILVNVDGAGEPTLGDADVGYDAGTAIPLKARYIQFFIKVKANSLPAR